MNARTAAAIIALLASTACSQVATLAEPDAALAFSLAANPAIQQLDPGAAARAQCWGAWKVLTAGLAAASGQGGIMTTIESLSEARAVFKSPQCAPIIADIALYIAGKVPFSPL